MSDEQSASQESPDDQRARQIEEIVGAYLNALRTSSGKISWQELAAQHPDLAPDLERRLRFVESVYLALQPDPNAPHEARDELTAFSTAPNAPANGEKLPKPVPRDRVVSVRCPHCGNLLKIVTHGKSEITCGSCGSAVSVDPDGTRTDTHVRTPKFISHFKILSFLGQGAFGTAYKAEDLRLNRNVAIKIPRSGSFANANDELRFVREARHAAQLRHPNIVQVHEIATDDGVPYLVSDYIDGITLSDLISGRRLTFREAAEMMATIAETVQFAHENGVIHRDLKPSNILLDQRNKPHVADFGLARQTEGEFTITLEGEVLGTPAYMSPEQASGKEVDVRTDVYSLGVMLYRLVVGELPFRGSQRMMIHQVLHDDPKSPRRLDERVPRDLDTIILKAMAKERDRRYQTAGDFARDVRCWLQSQPIAARPVGIWGKSVRWCRRNPTGALAAAGATVLLLTIAVISVAWGYREQVMRGIADTLKDKAVAKEIESLQGLLKLQRNNGTERMQAGDWFGSLNWFAESLKTATDLDAGSGANEARNERLRLGMLRQSLPKLVRSWSVGGSIEAIRFSADGKSMLATTRSGAVQVTDPDRDEVIVLQSSNNPEIWSSDLDPTGARACTATLENKASLWDARTGKLVGFLGHDSRVLTVSFSADGKWVATGGRDHKAGVWNAADGTLVAKFEHPGEYVGPVRFSPDGRFLLTQSRPDPDHPCELRLWDIEKRELHVPVMTCPDFPHDLIFNKSGDTIFAACNNGDVAIWNATTGELLGEPLTHSEGLNRVLLVDNEATLVASSWQGVVTFWDLERRTRKEHAIRNSFGIRDIAADPSSNFMAMANEDSRVRVVWQYCGRPVCAEIPHAGHPTSVGFHPDGRRIAVGGDDGIVRLWDLAGLAANMKAIRTQGEITSVAYSKDGRRLLVGSQDHTARQFDSTTLAPIGAVMQHDGFVNYCEYDDQERYVVTAGDENKAQVWDAQTGKPVGPPLVHKDSVLRARFVPGTDRLITTTWDGSGAIWKVGSDQPLHTFSQDKNLVGLKVHPDGKSFVLYGESPQFQIRSSDDGSPIGKPIQDTGLVYATQFSPSGRYLLTGSFGSMVGVVDLDSTDHASIRWSVGANVFSVSFARNEESVLTGTDLGDMTLWRKQQNSFVSVWSVSNPSASIDRIAVHPDLPLVIAAAGPKATEFQPRAATIEVRDLETGALLVDAPSQFRTIPCLTISPDKNHFATGSTDGTVRIWNLQPENNAIKDVRRLANFYNGFSWDDAFQKQPMSGESQMTEFKALRQDFPDEFACSPDEIKRWNDEVQWVRDQVAKRKTSK